MDPPEKTSKTAAVKPGSSILATLVVTLLLVLFAGGAGFLSGSYLLHSIAQPGASATPTAQPVAAKPAGPLVAVLPPIVTNLAGEKGGWVRLESAVVVEGERPLAADMTAKLTEDIAALLRTLSLHQISGASGFQHLREELNDRLRIRSGGKVREITLQSLIIE